MVMGQENNDYAQKESEGLTTPLLDIVLNRVTDQSKGIVHHKHNPVAMITYRMLYRWRMYVIMEVKRPLLKAILKYAKRYPNATKENTIWRNSHILIDFKDYFLKHYVNSGRQKMFEVALNVLIVENEHDPHYRFNLNQFAIFIADAVNSGKWDTDIKCLDNCWKE